MTNEFLKKQQELAREEVFNQWPYTAEFNKELMYPWIDTLIQQIITNTGEEIMRRSEGEKEITLTSPENETAEEYGLRLTERRQAIDTIKQHITSVTGVE